MSQFSLDSDVASAINDLKARVGDLESQGPSMVTWHSIAFTAGYGTLANRQPCQVGKDASGQVHLRGVVVTSAAPASGTVFGTLPSFCIPTESVTTEELPIIASGSGVGGAIIAAYLHIDIATGNMSALWTATIGAGLAGFFLGHQMWR